MMQNNLDKKFWRGGIMVIIITFAFMLALNFFTFYWGDDYTYMYMFRSDVPMCDTARPITSLADAFVSQTHHYMVQNGRFVAHFLVQCFVSLAPKQVFDVCNSLMFIFMIMLLWRFINVRHRWWMWMLPGFIFLLSPAFGLTCLWVSGSLNYLWAFTLYIATYLLYRDFDENTSYRRVALTSFLALVSGSFNEAFSPLFGMMFLVICYKGIKAQKKSLNSWLVYLPPLLLFGLGTLFVISSPGSFGRNYNDGRFIRILLVGVKNIILNLRVLYILIALLAFMWVKLGRKRVKDFCHEHIGILLGIGLQLLFFMVLGELAPRRAFMGLEMLSLVLSYKVFNILYDEELIHRYFANIVMAVSGIATVILAFVVFERTVENFHNNEEFMQAYIDSEDGNFFYDMPDFESIDFKYLGSHNVVYGWWPNAMYCMTNYYDKKYYYVLPKRYRDCLYDHPEKFLCDTNLVFDSLYTAPDAPFYVLPLGKTTDDSRFVQFGIRAVPHEQLTATQRLIARYSHRYDSIIEGGEASVAHYPHGDYAIIGKYGDVDERVAFIKVADSQGHFH